MEVWGTVRQKMALDKSTIHDIVVRTIRNLGNVHDGMYIEDDELYQSIEHHGSDDIPVSGSKEMEKLSECLKTFGEVIEKSPANMLLKEI